MLLYSKSLLLLYICENQCSVCFHYLSDVTTPPPAGLSGFYSIFQGYGKSSSNGCPPILIPWMDKCVMRYKAANWTEAKRLCSRHYRGGILELNRPMYHSSHIISLLDGITPIWVGARRDVTWYWSLTSHITTGNSIISIELSIIVW